MDLIESLIAQTEEYLQAAIDKRDRFKELVTLPDGTVDHQQQQRLEQLNAVVHRAKATLAKTKELRDPPKAAPIPDEVIAKAADEAAAASASNLPAFWIQPGMMKLRMVAVEGERAEVSAHREPDAGFTVPLYAEPAARRVPEGWEIERIDSHALRVYRPDGTNCYAEYTSGDACESMLFEVCSAMLAASPDPVAQPAGGSREEETHS